MPTAVYLKDFLACYNEEFLEPGGENGWREGLLEKTAIEIMERSPFDEASSVVNNYDGLTYFRVQWLRQQLLDLEWNKERPELKSGVKFSTFMSRCKDVVVIQNRFVILSKQLEEQEAASEVADSKQVQKERPASDTPVSEQMQEQKAASGLAVFKQLQHHKVVTKASSPSNTALDNAVTFLLKNANPTAENSRIKNNLRFCPPKEGKLFFKTNWIMQKLPHGTLVKTGKKQFNDYLHNNNKFVVWQNGVNLVSSLTLMPTDQALAKKLMKLIGIRKLNLNQIHSSLSDNDRLRVRSVSVLEAFITGNKNQFTLDGQFVRVNENAGTPSPAMSTLSLHSEAPSPEDTEPDWDFTDDEKATLIKHAHYFLLNHAATQPKSEWVPISKVRNWYHLGNMKQWRDELLRRTDMFAVSACDQIRLKHKAVIFPKEDEANVKAVVDRIIQREPMCEENTIQPLPGNKSRAYSMKWLAGKVNSETKFAYFRNAEYMKAFLQLFPSDYKVINHGFLPVKCSPTQPVQVSTLAEVKKQPHGPLSPDQEETLIGTLVLQLLNREPFGVDVEAKDLLAEYGDIYRNVTTLTAIAAKYPETFAVKNRKTIGMLRPSIPVGLANKLFKQLSALLSSSPYTDENSSVIVDETGQQIRGFLLDWVTRELIVRNSGFELNTKAAQDALKSFLSERSSELWFSKNCVNLRRKIDGSLPVALMSAIQDVLERPHHASHCYIGQGLKVFWKRDLLAVPEMPWTRLETTCAQQDTQIEIDRSKRQGLRIKCRFPVHNTERTYGTFLQAVGDEYGILLVKDSIVAFHLGAVCDANGDYCGEAFDAAEKLCSGMIVNIVIDFEAGVVLAVFFGQGNNIRLPSITMKEKEFIRDQCDKSRAMGLVPNSLCGDRLRKAFCSYVLSGKGTKLAYWNTVPEFTDHVAYLNGDWVFNRGLLTSTKALIRLILPEERQLTDIQSLSSRGESYVDLPLPVMMTVPKTGVSKLGGLLLQGLLGAVWRRREQQGVEIVIKTAATTMFKVVYGNSDGNLSPGHLVRFDLSGREYSCGAIVPVVSNVAIIDMDDEIRDASRRVEEGEARYSGHVMPAVPETAASRGIGEEELASDDLFDGVEDVDSEHHVNYLTVSDDEKDEEGDVIVDEAPLVASALFSNETQKRKKKAVDKEKCVIS